MMTRRSSQGCSTQRNWLWKQVDEYWYSEDLRINLVLKHNDPRTGSVILTVTQITRTDPDSSLFQIPDGYNKPNTGPEAAR
jgi:hypothetical protein